MKHERKPLLQQGPVHIEYTLNINEKPTLGQWGVPLGIVIVILAIILGLIAAYSGSGNSHYGNGDQSGIKFNDLNVNYGE
jgi:hypothetical protein